MRFLVLVAAASVGSAVAVASLKTVFPQQDAWMRASLRAAVSDLAQIRLSDLNPIQAAYNQVASEISSPRSNAALGFKGSPVVVGEFKIPTPIGIGQPPIGGTFAPRRDAIMRCNRGGATVPC